MSSSSCTSVYRSSESASRSSRNLVSSAMTAGSTSSSSARWSLTRANTCPRSLPSSTHEPRAWAVRRTPVSERRRDGQGWSAHPASRQASATRGRRRRLSAPACSRARWVCPTMSSPRTPLGAQDRLCEAGAGEAPVRDDAQAAESEQVRAPARLRLDLLAERSQRCARSAPPIFPLVDESAALRTVPASAGRRPP